MRIFKINIFLVKTQVFFVKKNSFKLFLVKQYLFRIIYACRGMCTLMLYKLRGICIQYDVHCFDELLNNVTKFHGLKCI